jgi:RNA ligase
MNYKFPHIENISDVLAHLVGYPEFIVAVKDEYTVIDYKHETSTTFLMTDENDLGGAIRRECRGIMFNNSDGAIISRPLHKFFNIGQHPETHPDLLGEHISKGVVYTKEDGSMLRPIVLNDRVYWGTRMGRTDTSALVEKFTEHHDIFNTFAEFCDLEKVTPIFEYVGPENRIVLRYNKNKLVLLCVRDNYSGEYLDVEDFVDVFYAFMKDQFDELSESIEIVQSIGKFNTAQELIDYVRPLKNLEGFVVDYNGHKVKIKADEYVLIHKVKDNIREDRYIAEMYLIGSIDDNLPILDEEDKQYVVDFVKEYENMLETIISRIDGLILLSKALYSGDKKRIALELVPNLMHKTDSGFIFSYFSGNADIRELILNRALAMTKTGVKYEEFLAWAK